MKRRSPIDMLDTFGEDRVMGISIKSLIAIGVTIAMAASGYGMLKRDIEIAMTEPVPPVSAEQFRLQTQLIDNAIIETKNDVSEIKQSMEKLEQRLFNQISR